MKKYILPTYLLLLSCLAVQAQEYGLHFMRDVWNAQYTNPGFMPRQSFVLALPSIHTSANIFGTNHAPVFRVGDTDGKYYFNHTEILDGLKRDVNLRMNFGVEAAGIGFKAGPLFISGFTNVRMSGALNVPEGLLGMAWRGTADYLGEVLEFGPSVNAMLYRETGMAVNYSLTPRLSVGVQAKRLSGLAGFQTERSKLQLMQSSEYYQTTFEADYIINYYAAGLIEPIETAEGPEGLDDFADKFETSEGSGPLDLISGIPRQNGGWAFGLGAEMIVTPRLTVAASVVDLGNIRWKKGTQQIQITQEATSFNGLSFSGISPEEDEADFSAVTDSLTDKFSVQANAGTEFVQGLAPRSYLSATYDVGKALTVGGLLHNEFGRYNTFTALALNAQLHLGRIFSLGGVYAIQSNTYNTVGLNSMMKLGPLQFYIIMDNLTPLFRLESTSGTQLRLGLNLTFGRKKMDTSIAQAKAGLLEQQEQLPEEQEVLAAQPEEELMAEPFALQPEPTNEPAPAAQPAPRETTTPQAQELFVLDLNFRDKKTDAPLSAVYVDVYQVDQQGTRSLARTRSYLNGKVKMSLSPDAAAYEVKVRAPGYEATTLTFQPGVGSPQQKYWYMKEEDFLADTGSPTAAPTPEKTTAVEDTAPATPPVAAETPPNRPTEEATAPTEAARPAPPAPSPIAEARPSQPMKKTTAATSRPALPTKDSRPTVPEPYTAGSSGAPVIHHIQLEFRDELSQAPVDAAYVDVYKLSEDGEETLVCTSRYPNGAFSVRLLLEPSVYQIKATAYGYEPMVLDFTPQTVANLGYARYMSPQATTSANIAEPQTPTASKPAEMAQVSREEPAANQAQSQPRVNEGVRNQPQGQLEVTQRTSLRESSTSKSAVLKRLGEGTKVVLLEKTNIYWWKVSYAGQVGWVKKALLESI